MKGSKAPGRILENLEKQLLTKESAVKYISNTQEYNHYMKQKLEILLK